MKFDQLGHILYTGISNNTTAQTEDAARVSLMRYAVVLTYCLEELAQVVISNATNKKRKFFDVKFRWYK